MNSTTNLTDSVSYACPFGAVLLIVDIFASTVFSAIGIVTNTLCVIVLALIVREERNAGHMFKYLLCKAVHDDLQFVFQVFAALYPCQSCPSYLSYSIQVWYIWFYTYFESVNELCSAFFEVAATLDCLLLINRRARCCQTRLCFVMVIVSVTIFSFCFYIYRLFEYQITKLPPFAVTLGTGNSSSQTIPEQRAYYVYEYTVFTATDLYKFFRVAHTTMRDFITMLLLVIFNILIMFTVRARMSGKRKLNQMPHHQLTLSAIQLHSAMVSAANEKSERAEVKAAAMVVIVGFNYAFGHLIVFIYYAVLIQPSVFRTCLSQIGVLPLYISYVTPLFIYVAFNRTFRCHFKRVMGKCFCFCC